eukprot:Awhi_evm1s8742
MYVYIDIDIGPIGCDSVIVLTNHTAKDREDEEELGAIHEYNRFWGWIGFFLCLILLFLINVPFLVFTVNMDPIGLQTRFRQYDSLNDYLGELKVSLEDKSPKMIIDHYNDVILRGDYNITLDGITTPEEVDDLLKLVWDSYEQYRTSLHQLFLCWLSIGSLHLLIYLLLISYVYYKRHHNLVKNKSRYFLIQTSVSGMLAISFLIIQKSFLFGQHDLSTEAYRYSGFFTICLVILSAQMYESALVCRMRYIYIVFTTKSQLKEDPWQSYFKVIPIHGLMYLISVCLLPFYFFVDGVSTEVYGYEFSFLPTIIVMFLGYPIW